MIYDFDNLSFQILGVLSIDHQRGLFNVKGRQYAALAYRFSGTAEFNFDGKLITSNPGDIIFIPEGTSYDVRHSGGNMIVIHFTDCNYHVPENISLTNKLYIGNLFAEILEKWEHCRSIHGTKAKVYNILELCYELNVREHTNSLAENAKQLIDENYSNPGFNIEVLAQKLYTSAPTLRRNFSDRFGIPPKQYLLKVRLDTAAAFLSQDFSSVLEASRKSGFNDERYFSRIFKKRYGKSPSNFNKQ
ncbi:MAG: helix-turn-helix domain-containing protein [Ruminococcaceae bacterium]|nr:helix-turn-helix domain-containing protein [Oscillospiraceae bacterium]